MCNFQGLSMNQRSPSPSNLLIATEKEVYYLDKYDSSYTNNLEDGFSAGHFFRC